jgi:DNA modification methylase
MEGVILNADCRLALKEMPDACVDMCMTSPPYWAQRNYGVDGQLGLEPTPEEYIAHLCDVFDEVKRVLKTPTQDP